MHFAVMRADKIRSAGHLANLVRHATRELPPENADPALKHLNRTLAGPATADAVMGVFRQRWPQKRRKDAVLAVEYVMSASHDWWEQATDKQKTDFVHSSMRWLEAKYGAENIVSVTLHRDEVTPHLSVFVVPLKDGKLNASQYIGNRSKMAEDQTTYAAALKHLGIVRGIEKSQAEHVKPSEFYARLQRAEKVAKSNVEKYIDRAELPQPSIRDLTSLASFVRKVAKAAAEPLVKLLQAQQIKITQLEEKVTDREATLDEHRRLYGAFFSAIDAIPSPAAKKRALDALGQAVARELEAEQRAWARKQEQELELERQVEYVAQRLIEAGKAGGELRGRFLAENMLESGDHETFKQWLQTPPATPPEAASKPAEPAPRVEPRKPDDGLDFGR